MPKSWIVRQLSRQVGRRNPSPIACGVLDPLTA